MTTHPKTMDWLSLFTLTAVVTCLALHLSQVCSSSLSRPRQSRRQRLSSLRRNPGGSSQGGTSGSLDDRGERRARLRQSLLKGLTELLLSDNGKKPSGLCSMDDPEDIQRMLPGRFLSEDDLVHILPGQRKWVTDTREMKFKPQRRVVAAGGEASVRSQFEQQAAFNIKTGEADFMTRSFCSPCLTEIGYEIVDQVVDFAGRNHSVINFKNAYQFIPAGRCLNENSPCSGGLSRCRQITRAHWSLVWTPGSGVNLVAHEVPSHCECLNLGVQGAFGLSRTVQTISTDTGNNDSGSLRSAGKPSEITPQSDTGRGGGELKMVGLGIDHGTEIQKPNNEIPDPLQNPQVSGPFPTPENPDPFSSASSGPSSYPTLNPSTDIHSTPRQSSDYTATGVGSKSQDNLSSPQPSLSSSAPSSVFTTPPEANSSNKDTDFTSPTTGHN